MINTIIIILTTIFSLGLIGYLIIRHFYKKAHHLPTGDCGCCHKGKDRLLKEYRTYCAKNK